MSTSPPPPAAPRPNVVYRPAEPSDIPAISAFHRGAPEALYRHEYWTHMPDRAIFMTAWNGAELVGTQAFMPYHMVVDGERMLTGRSERTLVSSTMRGGNVFQMMMRGCVDGGAARGHEFSWGATTQAIKAFKRTGFYHLTGHRRFMTAGVSRRNLARWWANRSGRPSFSPAAMLKVARTKDMPTAVRYAKAFWGPVSIASRAFAGGGRVAGLSLTSSQVPEVSLEALDAFYETLRGPRGRMFRLGLEPDFFDWMIVQGRHDTRCWFATRGGEIRAYLIGLFDDPVEGRVLDFAAIDAEAFAMCLDAFRAACDEAGCAFMRAIVNPQCAFQEMPARVLRRAGFLPFYTGGNSVVRPGRYEDMNVLAEPSAWYITDLWFLTSRDDPGASDT